MEVAWGKTKNTYDAEVVRIGEVQDPPTATRVEEDAEPFTFELAAPAPQFSLDATGNSSTAIAKPFGDTGRHQRHGIRCRGKAGVSA